MRGHLVEGQGRVQEADLSEFFIGLGVVVGVVVFLTNVVILLTLSHVNDMELVIKYDQPARLSFPIHDEIQIDAYVKSFYLRDFSKWPFLEPDIPL